MKRKGHTGISSNGVFGVQLVGDIAVILAGASLTNSGLHQTRERWQDVDGRVDTSVVQLTINKDLALGNITRQVRNRVSNIVVGHGQDGDLSNGSVTTVHSSCTLVDGRQVSVHVTGITTSAGHFFSSSGDLTESVTVG